MRPAPCVGLLAGSGRLPLDFAHAARKQGFQIKAAAIRGAASPRLAPLCGQISWFSAGQLGGILSFFKSQGITRAVMHGKVQHSESFKDLRLDWKALLVWRGLKDRSGPAILRAVAAEMTRSGIRLLDERFLMEDQLAGAGWLTGVKADQDGREAVRYGLRAARALARTGVGQSLLVKRTAVVSVEASEGTDEAVHRAGKWAGAGTILIKVSGPRQDWRFDVPTVGPGTVRALIRAKAKGMVLEAGKSFILEKEKTLAWARASGLFILGV